MRITKNLVDGMTSGPSDSKELRFILKRLGCGCRRYFSDRWIRIESYLRSRFRL